MKKMKDEYHYLTFTYLYKIMMCRNLVICVILAWFREASMKLNSILIYGSDSTL